MTLASAPTQHPDVQRCSLWARAGDLSPAGTAGTPAGFLLVDWPLPWPQDASNIEDLDEVRRLADERGVRIQLTVPIDHRPSRVALYEAPELDEAEAGRTVTEQGYTGTERDAEGPGGDQLAAAVRALFAGEGRPVAGGEILICTHGRRDACCGQFGTTLVMELTGSGHVVEGHALGTVAAAAGRPVRRTSHTGGHRFAPTMIVLPEGTTWGFADRELVHAVADRTGSIGDAAPRYRGCAGLPSAQLQALEAAVLAEVGWELFSSSRRGEALGADLYRLTVTGPDGHVSRWEATITAGPRFTQPVCGSPVGEEPAGKPTWSWEIGGLTRTD